MNYVHQFLSFVLWELPSIFRGQCLLQRESWFMAQRFRKTLVDSYGIHARQSPFHFDHPHFVTWKVDKCRKMVARRICLIELFQKNPCKFFQLYIFYWLYCMGFEGYLTEWLLHNESLPSLNTTLELTRLQGQF